MAMRSPREEAYGVKSSALPPAQEPIQIDPTHSAPEPRGPPIDSAVQRSNSTRRRKPSGQNSNKSDNIIQDELPSAPEPPKVPRGPPLAYRRPYESIKEQSMDGELPSSKSFAARAGIAPEQFSPRSQGYEKSDMIDDKRDSRRISRPLPYEAQDVAKSPREATYNSVNAGKATYHQQRIPSEQQPIRTNGGNYAQQAMSPEMEVASPSTRSRSQRYSTQQQQQQQQQQLMATEKSPLQKLELKFGDISKEEKRAKVELAEQKLREKEVPPRRRSSQLDVPDRQASTSKRAVSGPIYQRIADQAAPSERRRSQHVVPPNLQVDTGSRKQVIDSATPRSSRPVSALTPSSQPTPKRTSLDTARYDERGVRFNSQIEDINDTPRTRVVSAGTKNTALPKIYREDIPQGSSVKRNSQPAKPDIIPPQAVQSQTKSLNYVIPPQTAAAVEARKQVGFGTDASLKNPDLDEHHPRLSGLLLHKTNKEITNQSQPARGLSEWRSGGIALLTLADIKAPSQSGSKFKDHDYQAWWEQQQSGDRMKRSSKPASDVDQMDGYFDERIAMEQFEPPLLLKCGPLLRYCGMRTEKSTQRGLPGREIWRGSVMIVTEDKASTYTSVPTLRLFHQPIQLLPPPPQQFDEADGEGLSSEYVDPIGGLPRITRTGGTVYVKPIEDLEEGKDVSKIENDEGLYEETRTANVPTSYGKPDELLGRSPHPTKLSPQRGNGEQVGRYKEVKGIRLHAERGYTFWRFKLEIELGDRQQRVAYRINRGASVGFWVPARGKSMNIMFHSCNGFSMSINSNLFSGPDPLWRDVLNAHQIKPFHVMIGGGDQIYNDAVMKQTRLFSEWLEIKNPHHKHEAQFTPEMRDELELFYLERYCMWFSQGLFGMANSQIPMINMWDDHDIIDGFGSYPHHFMRTPVFSGVGNVAFKYYMLFQQQSVSDELTTDEPSWLLGASPGPYINELSRSMFVSLGNNIALLALDCRTERMRDEILSEASYDLVFERCHREIVKGDTKHLLVLLGVPIAYPRLVWLENVLTSRVLDPVKALGRMGLFGNFLNKFDGGVEILDDLDDHWTAKNHKDERNWFIEELQELAAEKSIRITILGGDVHLAAIGQFYSSKALNIPKDRDFRYMPNVISSAIVNTPPPDMMADVLNKRNKVHHLNAETEENMIPMFTHDVDGKPRNNKHLLPKRNWCSITEYTPGLTPPPTPPSLSPTPSQTSLSGKSPGILQRTLSLGRGDSSPGNQLIRRLSLSNRKPVSFADDITSPYQQQNYPGPTTARYDTPPIATRPVSNFHRRPTNLSEKAAAKGAANNHHVDLEYGLDISLNCEIKQGDPSGSTEQYRLLVPALFYDGPLPEHKKRKEGLVKRFASRRKSGAPSSYPSNDNGGSRTNSRDSWAAGDRNSFDTDSVSVYDDSKIPATTSTTPQGGLFRRLSNRIQRSTSQTRGLPTNGNISQNYQQQPPEPFKPRPQPSQQRPQQQEDEEDEEDDEEAQSQICHQQQKQRLLQKQNPLQGALRRPGPSSSSTAAAARNPSGAYTVDNKSPRSPPTSFAQKPYFPPSPPPPVLQSSYLAQPTPKSTQSTPTATATAFNRTPPIPRRGPVNANPTATKTTATTTPVTATSRTTRNNHDPNKRNGRAYSFTSDQDHDRNNASQTDSESDYEPRNHHHHPAAAATAAAARTTRGARAGGMTNVASGPSGRGNGAAKFFGADYDDLQNGNVSGNGNRIKKGGVAGGGYGGIEAYTSSSQSHSNAQRSGGRQGSYGYENGYENEDGNGGREKRGWRKFLSI